MSDEKARSYEVLALTGDTLDAYIHLGVVNADNADAAIRAVIERNGMPNSATGRVVAVPSSNWNARDVEIRQEPVIDVLPVKGAQASLD